MLLFLWYSLCSNLTGLLTVPLSVPKHPKLIPASEPLHVFVVPLPGMVAPKPSCLAPSNHSGSSKNVTLAALFDHLINNNAHLTSATPISLCLYQFIHGASYYLSLCMYVWSMYICIDYLPSTRIYTLQGREFYLSCWPMNPSASNFAWQIVDAQ